MIRRALSLVVALFCVAFPSGGQYNPADKCSCDSALSPALLLEASRSNIREDDWASSVVGFCRYSYEESKDERNFNTAGNYAEVIFDGHVANSESEYREKQEEVCTHENLERARSALRNELRTGPSLVAVTAAFDKWGACKENCAVWGLSCYASEPFRSGEQLCSRVSVRWNSEYLRTSATFDGVSLSPGLVAVPTASIPPPGSTWNVSQLPFFTVCANPATTPLGQVALSVTDHLGGSTATDSCELAISFDRITFGAVNANGYVVADAVNVELSDESAKWFVQRGDPSRLSRFFVASSGAPSGISRAHLFMNFAAKSAAVVRVAVVQDLQTAREFQPTRAVSIPAHPLGYPANSGTRRNVDLGIFDVREGSNYIIIESDGGSESPRVNGFWFSY